MSGTNATRTRRLLCVALTATFAAGNAVADLPHVIERTADQIRLRVSNDAGTAARCRFRLQLQPVDARHEAVEVDVDLVVPARSDDAVVWRVVGDVSGWRIVESWTLDCERRGA